MRRSLIFSFIIVAISGVFYSVSSYVVWPDGVAIVTRGDRVVRVEQPGLRWHIPLLERVSHVATMRVYQPKFHVDAKLADGSACLVSGVLTLRVNDPVKAFKWRLANSADLSLEGSRDDGKVYTEAVKAFRSRLLSEVENIQPLDAAGGAIEKLISNLRFSSHLADGTMILQSDTNSVSCSQRRAKTEVRRPKPKQRIYGDFKPFQQTPPRPTLPSDVNVHRFELQTTEVIMRDRRDILIEGVKVGFRVVDPKRFNQTLGKGKRGLRHAELRLGNRLEVALRMVGGSQDYAAFETFDPLALAEPGPAGVAEFLKTTGLEIVELGGANSGYRLLVGRR